MPSVRQWVFGRRPQRTLARIGVLIVLAWALFRWVLIPVRAEGISMEPTYQSGRLIVVNRLAYRLRPPARGDIVAIRLAGPHVLYVKRVVGLPGDRLAIDSGLVSINGETLMEPYVQQRRPWDIPALTVGDREYYVIGDNRGMNAADHEFGRVDANRILGKVIF